MKIYLCTIRDLGIVDKYQGLCHLVALSATYEQKGLQCRMVNIIFK